MIKIFNKLSHIVCYHCGKVIFVAFILLLISGFFANRIVMQTQFSDMLPQELPTVQEFNRIISDFYSASSIFIVIEGEDTGTIIKAAEELAPILAQLKNIRRVDYRVDTDFIRKHAFLLQKEKDLKDTIKIFSNLELLPLLQSINDNFEKEVIADEDRFEKAEDELRIIQSVNGLIGFLSPGGDSEKVRQFLLGDEFFFSPDKKMLLLQVQPYISIDDYFPALDLADKVRKTVNTFIRDTINSVPITIGITGMIPMALEEKESIVKGMAISSVIAVILILTLLIFSFKMWTAPVIAIITLICGIIYTAGFIGTTLGYVNLFTAFFAVLLLGLGIDFSIHLTTGFTEAKSKGLSIDNSIKKMYEKVGRGMVAGAMTTAFVFFTFTVTGLKVLVEMGLVLGAGILITLISTLVILPAFFCLQHRLRPSRKPTNSDSKVPQFILLEKLGIFIIRHRLSSGLFLLVITVVLFIYARQVGFQYDMMEMMPKGMPSVLWQNRIIEKFEISPDAAMVTTETIEETRIIEEAMEKKSLVGSVDSISKFIPPYSDQKESRIPLIKRFRKTLENKKFNYSVNEKAVTEIIIELNRIEDNIIEISQLSFIGGQDRVSERFDEIIESGVLEKIRGTLNVSTLRDFQKSYIPAMRELLLEMASGGIITLETLPEEIRDRFISRDGSSFLTTIYPRGNIWDERILRAFSNQVSSIEPRTSGTPTFFLLLIDLIAEKGRLATFLSIFIIFIILTIDFKSIRFSLIAMVPIILGAIWMIGIMQIFGIKFDFSNIMAIPLILGIGIDDAIHIIHRYRIEGRKIPVVLRSAGKAIFLTSLTTMIGFGSLGFSPHRGLAGMGYVLAIGVGCCFLTSVFVLPVILGDSGKNKGL